MQGVVPAMLRQALQLLDQSGAALHAGHAERPAQAAGPVRAEGHQPHEPGGNPTGKLLTPVIEKNDGWVLSRSVN